MVIVTKHAVNRYIERGESLEVNQAFNYLLKTLNPLKHKLMEALDIVQDVRVPLDNEMLAICIKNKKNLVVTTCRKRKYK